MSQPPPAPGEPDPHWAERFEPPPPTADIAGYLRRNALRYTRDALDQRLIAAGHPPEAIAAAWATVEGEDDAAGRRDRRRQTAAIIGGSYLVVWIVVVVLAIVPSVSIAYSTPALLAGILAVALFVPGFIAVIIALASGWLRRAGVGRVVAFSFVPMLILFALAGTCVAAVRPS
jgi:uncharacterized membrane protein